MKKSSSHSPAPRFMDTPIESDKSPSSQEARAINKEPISKPTRAKQAADFSGQMSIRIPKSLHAKLSVRSEEEGVFLSEYILYKLSQ